MAKQDIKQESMMLTTAEEKQLFKDGSTTHSKQFRVNLSVNVRIDEQGRVVPFLNQASLADLGEQLAKQIFVNLPTKGFTLPIVDVDGVKAYKAR